MAQFLKVGFGMIMIMFFIMFLNQMPEYLGPYGNYIVMGILLFVGGMFFIGMRK